jgi:hypothetical protein
MPAVDHAGQWLRQLSWRVGMSANVLRQSAARMTTDDQREAVGEIVAGETSTPSARQRASDGAEADQDFYFGSANKVLDFCINEWRMNR